MGIEKTHFLIFLLLSPLVFLTVTRTQCTVGAEGFTLSDLGIHSPMPSTLSIGQFEAPATVYASKYFYLNATINDVDGKTDFVNATIQISNAIILKWNNATDEFTKYQDTNNYCTLNTAGSIRTHLNTTAHKLSWKIKLDWTFPEGTVDVVVANTKVYDSAGNSRSNSCPGLFSFEDGLIVNSASVDDERINPSDTVTFSGIVYYEGTSTPPATGNSALDFDGSDNYVEVTHSTSINPIDSITVEAWINVDSLGGYRGIVGKWHSDLAKRSYLLTVDGVNVEFFICNGDNYLYASKPLTAGVWHYVVGTYDGANILVYVDGVAGTPTPTSIFINFGTDVNVRIGSFFSESLVHLFDGVIDEVRIYNRALNQTEIREHYQSIYKNETGLVLHLNFDGDTEDSSGQGNHGTNYGATWTDGYANIDIKVELGGTLKETVALVNSTSGNFSIPLTSESTVDQHRYNLYATTLAGNIVQNQTVNVIVDRLKIVLKGATDNRVNIGSSTYVYFNVTREYDNALFDGTKGTVYINGTAATWDETNRYWKLSVNQSSVTAKNYVVSSITDTEFDISTLNDQVGAQRIIWAHPPWYDPIIRWLVRLARAPLIWGVVATFIILAALFKLGIIEVKIEKPPEPTRATTTRMKTLFSPVPLTRLR